MTVERNDRLMRHYDRFATVEIDDVLQLILDEMASRLDDRRYVLGKPVKVISLRLRTFATKGTTCLACGLKATHFAIERDSHQVALNGSYHLNLWGIHPEGHEVLFTHDHTLSRGLGGADHISNTQTMCGPCNWDKGEGEAKLYNELYPNGKHGRGKNGTRRKVQDVIP